MTVVGPIETLTAIISRMQRDLDAMRAERDLSRSEVLRLRRLLSRVMGQLRHQDEVKRIREAIEPHEGEPES